MNTQTCPKRQLRAACAEVFGIEEHRLIGRGRTAPVVLARHAFCYILRRRFPGISYPRIGRLLGGRDHSTIIHAVRQFEAQMAGDPVLRAKAEALIAGRLRRGNYDAHVLAWCAFKRWEVAERERVLGCAVAVHPSSPLFRSVVAKGVHLVSSQRQVKAKNALVEDDRDALRRKRGSDALSGAIAAAGGWR